MFDENDCYIYPMSLQVLDDYQIILEFSNGKVKLFDCSYLLEKPLYAPLQDDGVFRSAVIEDGVLSWCDGGLDIAPETLYLKSIEYSHPDAEQLRAIQELTKRFGKVA